ncbi:Csu type fimbrial protein [Methylocystis echinoides]|uniref:Spore coat protein U n=1 Tax=Methylocystis echinoides TaxID=29468 RepID=A0A9W6GXY5_9HYPH|nr:spore coat U domain-containing protein [Methylocystis echinoides]GLI95042.1 spore coat protein U [Methylocystis echinoides]
MKRILTLTLAAGLAVAGAAPAVAATATANLAVSMSILGSCTVTGGALNFGSLSSLSADVDVATTIGVNCSSGTAYSVGLNAGAGAGATYAARKMTSGATTVNYALYTDAARTTVWTEASPNMITGSGTGAAVNLNVYGRVPAQAVPGAGTYSDTVTVTVNY